MFYRQHISDNGVVEVRRQSGTQWSSGYFDNHEAIITLPEQYPHDNLYSSLNRIGGKTATNKIDSRDFVTDGDVTGITRLLFDFDPVRPSDTPSTEVQLQAAKERASHFIDFMNGHGFPSPAKAISGNGCHVLYRCDLDIRNIPYVKRLYEALQSQFSDDLVDFDRSVSSLGQITRLYGSINHKGIEAPDAPHRHSSIWMPDDFAQVPSKVLWKLICELDADKAPQRRPAVTPQNHALGTGDYKTLDIVSWFRSAGLYLKPMRGIKHAVRCPFEHNHSTKPHFSEAVIFENDGYPGFHCSHNSCQGITLFGLIEAMGGADSFCSTTF